MVHVPVILSVSVTTSGGERFDTTGAVGFSFSLEEDRGADELFADPSDEGVARQEEIFCRRVEIPLLVEPGECDEE